MKSILVALGLSPDADESAAVIEIQKLVALESEIKSLTGAAKSADAIGALGALKITADQAAVVAKELAALKLSTVDAEAKRLMDQASTDGRLTPAKRGEVEAMYAKHGIDAIKTTLSLLPVVASSAGQGPRPVVPTTAGGDVEISAMELEIAKNIVGSDPVALEKHLNSLREYKRARANGVGR